MKGWWQMAELVSFFAGAIGRIIGGFAISPMKWLWERFFGPFKLPSGLIIFITGANGAGKSTIARKLAKRWSIKPQDFVPTNLVREGKRADRELYIAAGQQHEYDLLCKSAHKLEGPDQYAEQSLLLSEAIVYNANYLHLPDNGAIFEGINILPNYIDGRLQGVKKALFIHLIADKSILSERLDVRTSDNDAKAGFLDNIEQILVIQTRIADDFMPGTNQSNRFTIESKKNTSVRNIVKEVIKIVRKYQKEL